jgi:hypothetical protein
MPGILNEMQRMPGRKQADLHLIGSFRSGSKPNRTIIVPFSGICESRFCIGEINQTELRLTLNRQKPAMHCLIFNSKTGKPYNRRIIVVVSLPKLTFSE